VAERERPSEFQRERPPELRREEPMPEEGGDSGESFQDEPEENDGNGTSGE
jgi:hypothetical protein